MNRIRPFSILALFLLSFCVNAQNFTLSGYIKDKQSGEELIGATIYVTELKTGATTNPYGFYSLTLQKGNYTITYSFVGYAPIEQKIVLDKNIRNDIEVNSTEMQLQAVEITAERKNENVESIEMSTVNVSMETIKKIPALMGEVDIIRAIQLLPGVQSGGEGSTGFFVRGGGVDQNKILLDEATVFNASHLMGFFSVFNQDAIKDAQLYKGGIPARYGGRLSSVLDIRMKEGNMKRLSVAGGIGLISSRLTVEAPIVKDKSSFIVSGRRTYADLFLKFAKDDALKKSKLNFYDLNGKFNYKLNDKNRIFVSGYFGRDVLGLSDFFQMGWGNATITTRWNHLFSDKLFSNVTLIYSKFDYKLGIPDGITAFEWLSQIKNYSVKNDYTYYLNAQNTLQFGVDVTFLEFNPAEFNPLEGNEVFTSLKLPKKYAMEYGVYLSNEQKIGGRLSAQYGLRLSMFQNIGPEDVYSYSSSYDTVATTQYKKGEVYNTYFGPEPRLGVKFTLDENSSIKASYNRMNQYLHLANNSTTGTPLDIWFPSSRNIKPQRADQIGIGYFRNFLGDNYQASVEVYYKTMQNAIDFRDNATLIFNPLLEGEIRTGTGKAYGSEFFLRKNEGKLTGWISYTLSKVTRTIEQINDGKPYIASYDRRNNVSVVLSYEINPQIMLSATWVYITGMPLTAPSGKFNYQGSQIPLYTERNGDRIPDYHRADFAATYYIKKKKGKRIQHDINLSVYNLYNRKNAFSITFRDNPDAPGSTQAIKTSLFGIIPTVGYNFKF